MAEENALLPEAGEKKYSSLFDELRDCFVEAFPEPRPIGMV